MILEEHGDSIESTLRSLAFRGPVRGSTTGTHLASDMQYKTGKSPAVAGRKLSIFSFRASLLLKQNFSHKNLFGTRGARWGCISSKLWLPVVPRVLLAHRTTTTTTATAIATAASFCHFPCGLWAMAHKNLIFGCEEICPGGARPQAEAI